MFFLLQVFLSLVVVNVFIFFLVATKLLTSDTFLGSFLILMSALSFFVQVVLALILIWRWPI